MKDTNISFLTSELYNEFLDFSKKAFPQRKKIEELIKYQIFQNPLLENKSCPKVLVACNNKKEIVGQFVCNPCQLYLNGGYIEGHRTYDFHVLGDFRKRGTGAALARGVCKYAKPCITVGVSKMGINIALSVGELVGSLYKFLWFKNPACWIKVLCDYLSLGKFLNSRYDSKSTKFPEVFLLEGQRFQLTRRVETWKEVLWDNGTLQFRRTKDFIRWRFLQRPNIYYLYTLDCAKRNSYFVVRKSKWRTLNILEIVDYRVSYQDKKTFCLILKASKFLAKELGLDGAGTRSSHTFFDRCLFSNFFIRTRLPEVVITNLELDIDKKKIKNRDFLYVTGADCDSEFISGGLNTN